MRKGTKRKTTKKGEPKSKPVEAEKNEPSQSEIEPAEETKPEEPSPNAEPEPSKEAAGKGKRKRGKVAEPAAEPEPSKEAAGKGRGKRVKVAEPAAEPEAEPSKEAAGKGRRKRVKVAEPEAEPEYFPEKRNLEDLWQQVFPVGTEWDQMDMVYEYKWNFSNLEEALEEGGELHNKKVYLFGCTEPQLVPFKDQSKVTMIPVVVAVVSPFPPSDKIGIKSVQRETEEIVPMKQMKMDWVPYIPLEDRESQVERLKNPQIFILSCNQRRAGLSHLKIERVKKFEYCLPYFYDPLQEDELEQSTVVPILYPIDPKPVFCEFDWEFDEVEEFTDKLIEDEELTADQKDEFKKFLEEKIREAKKANRSARDARKKAREEMNQQAKDAFKNMQFYKFYPGPSDETPDVSGVKAPFINRYYGKAHKVI